LVDDTGLLAFETASGEKAMSENGEPLIATTVTYVNR